MYNTSDFFLGNWRIDRECSSKSSSADNFQAFGKACFKIAKREDLESGNTTILQYSEELTLNNNLAAFNSSTPKATQSYQYYFKDGTVEKYNQKSRKQDNDYGKMFTLTYRIEGNESIAKGIYKCGKDTYQCTFTFMSETSFKMMYEVSGPQKDYSITSIFTKYEQDTPQGHSPLELQGDDTLADFIVNLS